MNDKIEKYKPLLKVIQKVKPNTFKALVDAVALQNQSAEVNQHSIHSQQTHRIHRH